MRSFNKKTLAFASGSLVLVMLLNACDSNISNNESQNTYSIESSVTSITSESVFESSDTSSAEPIEYTIETATYSCPVSYNRQLYIDFYSFIVEYAGKGPYDTFYALGWDNKLLNNEIKLFLQDTYSISDGNYTIDNFHYFQFLQGALSYHGGDSLNETVGWLEERERFAIIARSILQQEGLRYIIDEIPSSYFEERFPGFIDMYGDYDTRQEMLSIGSRICEDLRQAQNTSELILKLESLSEKDQFILYVLAIREYNEYRNAYMEIPQIKQVRDESTGRHVLVPDESQLRRMQNCLDDYQGYDFDITQTEGREHYYDCFGIYPEEIIPVGKVWNYT